VFYGLRHGQIADNRPSERLSKPNTMGTLAGPIRYPEMDNNRVIPDICAEFVAINARVGGK
jgi:hypothetical protein